MHVVHQGRQDPKSRSLAALAAALLLLAACSAGGKAAALSTTTTTTTESSGRSTTTTNAPRTADNADWVGQGPRPVSRLVGAGSHIVYLGVDEEQQLQLIALDPSTGEVAWQRPSTAASHVPGVEQQLVTDGDTVFNVEPPAAAGSRVAYPAQGSPELHVVAVDARTGDEEWRHPFDDVSTPLEKCGDGLCVLAYAPRGHISVTRLDLSTGDVLSEGAEAFEPLAATDGEFAISAARDSDDVVLTSEFGQTVVWTHSKAELFASNDVTPDGGWSGFRTNGVWVVWIGGPPPASGETDDSLGATSGITDDGRLLWTRSDTAPCFPFSDDPMTVPVLCGEIDVAAQRITFGTVEGLDAPTGSTQWSLPVGDVDFENLGSSLVRLTATGYALRSAGGDVAVDMITGPSGPAVAPVDGWCETFGQSADVEGDTHVVATSWSPCTLGEGASDVPPTVVPEFAGPTVNGFGAWVENREVRAAKVA